MRANQQRKHASEITRDDVRAINFSFRNYTKLQKTEQTNLRTHFRKTRQYVKLTRSFQCSLSTTQSFNYAGSSIYRRIYTYMTLVFSRKCTPSPETTILRRPVLSRRQLALGYSKIRYLRNYCINVGRASEIWHGLSFPPSSFLFSPEVTKDRVTRFSSCLRQPVVAKRGENVTHVTRRVRN